MKKKIILSAATIVLCLFAFLGCTKSGNVRWVYYDETNCADRWEYTNNNEKLKDNIIEYLDGRGVTVHEIEIFRRLEAESCSDCNCRTGRQIKCKIKKSDLDNARSEGFRE
jgi:hypothetical protein